MYLTWLQDTKAFFRYFLVHVFIIGAALLHWQAVFAGVGIWITTILLNGKEISYRRAAAVLSLYVFTITMIYLSYINPLQEEFMKRMDFLFMRSGLGGGMHPHAGGMIIAAMRYFGTSQYLKLLVAIAMFVALGIALKSFWNRETNRKVLCIYGLSCYVSWITTTSGLDDFHASWLVVPFMIMMIGGYETCRSRSGIKRLLGYGLVGCVFLLSGFGSIFAVRTIYLNPRVNLYEKDLRALDSEFNLKASTVFGERETMWYFKFDPAVTFPVHGTAEYFIGPAVKATDSINICDKQYALVKKRERFALYRLVGGGTL